MPTACVSTAIPSASTCSKRGEDPLVCAVRELGEETGFTAGRIVPLGAYHSSPGFSSERLYLYLALDLSRGEAHPDEGEFLDLVKLPFSELLAMVKRGEISDGKTAIAALQAEQSSAQSFSQSRDISQQNKF